MIINKILLCLMRLFKLKRTINFVCLLQNIGGQNQQVGDESVSLA